MLLLVIITLIFILFLALRFVICSPRPAHIPFANRHVFITGGSSGIGLELAKLAVKEGAYVSIMARDSSRLTQAKLAIANSTGKDVKIYCGDVKDFESVSSVARQAGAVDILICSHGISIPKSLEDSSLDEINHVLDTNLRGNLHVIKAMLPCLKNRKDDHYASISIVSSQAGQVGVYGFAAYAASKFGLKGMAEALQQEVHCYNIRVSLIYPPDTFTPGFEKENETKPEITKLISGSSTAMDAVDVARKAIDGIKAGKFAISCNFDGWMLCIATAGMSPQPSPLLAFAEIFLLGFLRLVGLCYTWTWYQALIKWAKQQHKDE